MYSGPVARIPAFDFAANNKGADKPVHLYSLIGTYIYWLSPQKP